MALTLEPRGTMLAQASAGATMSASQLKRATTASSVPRSAEPDGAAALPGDEDKTVHEGLAQHEQVERLPDVLRKELVGGVVAIVVDQHHLQLDDSAARFASTMAAVVRRTGRVLWGDARSPSARQRG
jgi:hypothetical protein